MSASITEAVAWDLVRSVREASSPSVLPLRVTHHPRPDVWLQVDAVGRWDAAAPVTAGARDVFDLYLPLLLPPSLVIAQVGQSVDGRIATATGHSHYVTGQADIRRLHRLRALVDAVVVGAGTVAADDPRLTVREVEGESPARVVLDPNGRLDASHRVFSDGAVRTVVVHRSREGGQGAGPSVPRTGLGCERLEVPVTDEGGFDLRVLLEALRGLGFRRLLVEGGGVTVSRFLEAGVVDRLHVAVAPLVIGSGRPALSLTPIASLDEALRPPCRYFRLGDDVLFDFDLRAPIGPS